MYGTFRQVNKVHYTQEGTENLKWFWRWIFLRIDQDVLEKNTRRWSHSRHRSTTVHQKNLHYSNDHLFQYFCYGTTTYLKHELHTEFVYSFFAKLKCVPSVL